VPVFTCLLISQRSQLVIHLLSGQISKQVNTGTNYPKRGNDWSQRVDPGQCSYASQPRAHAQHGFMIVDVDNLPVSGVGQNAGSGEFVNASWLPKWQQLTIIMKNKWSG